MWLKFYSVTIQMKATEQYFHMVLAFFSYFTKRIFFKLFLTLNSIRSEWVRQMFIGHPVHSHVSFLHTSEGVSLSTLRFLCYFIMYASILDRALHTPSLFLPHSNLRSCMWYVDETCVTIEMKAESFQPLVSFSAVY